MRVNAGRGRSLLLAGAVIVALASPATAPARAATAPAAGGAGVTGAAAITTLADGSPGPAVAPTDRPCWTDVLPYPFGSDGMEVKDTDLKSTRCSSDPLSCYLTVTSMAFRSWNRGLAAASLTQGSGNNAYGVWTFNGTRWAPDQTFPGSDACNGSSVAYAGKLDYWLVRPIEKFGHWSSICRFDSAIPAWEPLALPQATLDRVTYTNSTGQTLRRAGDITSTACFSWDNCWFFGSFGTVVHWDGTALSDASPPLDQSWLATEYQGAVARFDQAGNPFGVAVGATSAGTDQPSPLPSQPDGTPPPELFGSSGGSWSPLSFTPATIPQPGDPYRTDLVGLDFDSSGSGWLAGNPAGFRATRFTGVSPDQPPAGRPAPTSPEPSPLVPIYSSGGPSGCTGPAATRFTYTYSNANTAAGGAFLWSAISAVPLAGDAWASGRMRPAKPGSGPHEEAIAEPVIAHVGCDGSTTVTRFRIPDPTYKGTGTPTQAPADRGGTATAVAANATNDAWLATSRGTLGDSSSGVYVDFPPQPPHFYRYTDGNPPNAAAGDDNELRTQILQLDPEIIRVEPSTQTITVPGPTTVNRSTTVSLPPAVFGVKFKIRGGRAHPRLYLTFRLRRPTTLGAQALRRGHVVASSAMRRFGGPKGQLVLALDPKRWPTGVRFVTDAPTTTLKDPGPRLRGAVKLVAQVAPYHGHQIVSVRFEYAPTGTETWTAIATVAAAPWTATFDTTQVPAGLYDLRAVATDATGQVGASPAVTKRRIGG